MTEMQNDWGGKKCHERIEHLCEFVWTLSSVQKKHKSMAREGGTILVLSTGGVSWLEGVDWAFFRENL